MELKASTGLTRLTRGTQSKKHIYTRAETFSICLWQVQGAQMGFCYAWQISMVHMGAALPSGHSPYSPLPPLLLALYTLQRIEMPVSIEEISSRGVKRHLFGFSLAH